MNENFLTRKLPRDKINERVKSDPAGFVAEQHTRFMAAVEAVAKKWAVNQGRCLIMLSGPSSSGKTTTAGFLCDFLRTFGTEAHRVSLDNFYRGQDRAPVLPNGHYDYESPEALNLEELGQCMTELIAHGRTMLPTYNFEAGGPDPIKTELAVSDNAFVIFEGIHALNPRFTSLLSGGNLKRLFINTISPIVDEHDKKLLARRDIRLIRRMLRDERFRGASPAITLNMWPQVMRGENLYLFPNTDGVDDVIDTTHAFEPGMFAGLLLPELAKIDKSHPSYNKVVELMSALEGFEQIAEDLLPPGSLLHEFIG